MSTSLPPLLSSQFHPCPSFELSTRTDVPFKEHSNILEVADKCWTLTGAPKGAQLFLPCLKMTGKMGLVKCKCNSERECHTLNFKQPSIGTSPDELIQIAPMENNP